MRLMENDWGIDGISVSHYLNYVGAYLLRMVLLYKVVYRCFAAC